MSLGGAIGRNQRVTENQKKITHRAPLKGKDSVSLFLCGSWRHYNYETTETQRHREQKKERGIVLPEKKVKKLCVSVPLWFRPLVGHRHYALQPPNHRGTENKKTTMILRQGSCPKDEKPGGS